MAAIYSTPEDYLESIIAALQANGTRITDFHVGAAARTFFYAEGAALSQQSLVLDQLQRDMHLSTAEGDALDAKGADYLVPRKAGIAATGSIQISRTTTGVAVTIPAGATQFLTAPAPGQTPVSFQATQDAVFASGDTTKTVSAIALTVGAAGNIADQTKLYPLNPIGGFDTATGFKASGAFTNGVDAESDDAYRARIPIDVQGRVNGTALALQAAALSVPGVASANVLGAGDTRANGTTVAAGNVEVYYAGSAGLLAAVQSACALKSVENQQVTVFTATAERVVANLTVTAKTGTDTTSLATAVAAAVQAAVDVAGVGQPVYLSAVVQAADAVAGALGVTVPFSDFRKFADTPGTSSSTLTPAKDRYPDLQLADCTVAVSLVA